MNAHIKQLLFVTLLIFCFNGLTAQTSSPADDLAKVRRECRQQLLSDTVKATEQSYRLTDDIRYDTDGQGYFKSLNQEGYWVDINYKSTVNSDWSPSWHLYRLMLIYRVYNKNKEPRYLEAVHRALKYWIKSDPICPNWWQNQINTPYVYSSLTLMLDTAATVEEMHYLDQVLAPRVPQPNPTGQNKIWQHDIEARIALIHHDEKKFGDAMVRMQSVIKISTEEGIQPDYSFHQHGAMLQFGNYGIHFVNSLLFWMKVTADSPFAFDTEKQQIISDYCIKGLRYSVYKKAMDITAIGRQLRKYAALKRGYNLYDDFNMIKSFVKENPCRFSLDGFGELPCKDENKSFWRSAYMLQSKANRFMMSVKMQGSLFRAVESINSENLLGSFLNDGVTLIQRSGNEYNNVEPLWNWTMLPGITCDTTINPSAKETFASHNRSDFVGQVSNDRIGISTMYYNRLGLQAYKSYFFINEMMIALGAGISAPNLNSVVTTVNQRFKRNKPLLGGKGIAGSSWMWQDSIAYFFPDKDQVVKNATAYRKGSWTALDKASPSQTEADSVLTIYVPHNKNSTYAYGIQPAIGLSEAKKTALKPGFQVLQNTKQLQAVRCAGTVMVVFYQPGNLQLSSKLRLTTDQACLLIYEKGNIWIADPGRKLQKIQLKLNEKNILVQLPKDQYAGSPIKIQLNTL